MDRSDHTAEPPAMEDGYTNDVSTQPLHIANGNNLPCIMTDSLSENLSTTSHQTSNQCFHSTSTRMQKRQERVSPTNSPHKLGKVGPKSQRTVAVKNLSTSLHETVSNASLHGTTNTMQVTLTIQNFQEHSDEKKEQDTLQIKLQSYIIQKFISDAYPETRSKDGVLSELRQFLNEDNFNGVQIPSTVHYLELVKFHRLFII